MSKSYVMVAKHYRSMFVLVSAGAAQPHLLRRPCSGSSDFMFSISHVV